jgi:pimeloyl-ACP methyl ester carboxylesterase
VDVPEVRYAKTPDGAHIAYQVVGRGPGDLLLIGPGYSNVELLWSLPTFSRFLRALSSIARTVILDPRGMGLSDPLAWERLPTLETRVADPWP